MTVTIEFEDGSEEEFDGTRFEDGFVIGQNRVMKDMYKVDDDASRFERFAKMMDKLALTMFSSPYEIEEKGFPEHRVREIK